MATPIVKVTTFVLDGKAHIYIHRDDDTKSAGRHYTRPTDCPSLARLARHIHLGTIRGNTHVTPFMSGVVGWTACPLFE